MDSGTAKLTELGRDHLRTLLQQCTTAQVEFFNKLYGSVDIIPLEKIPHAIWQCDNTIKKNRNPKEG